MYHNNIRHLQSIPILGEVSIVSAPPAYDTLISEPPTYPKSESEINQAKTSENPPTYDELKKSQVDK